MASLPNRIETYAEYETLLARLVKAAVVLEDPLLEKPERDLYMAAYNHMDKVLGDYSERVYRNGL